MAALIKRCPNCMEELHVTPDGKEWGHLEPCIATEKVMTEEDLFAELGKKDFPRGPLTESAGAS